MEKYLKIVRNLPSNQRRLVIKIWQRVLKNDLKGLKIKKLIAFDNYYAIRKGKIRIVFKKEETKNKIINIDYRKSVYKTS